MSKPIAPFAVSVIYLNGVRTVNTFQDIAAAKQHAQLMADVYKGCLVYLGSMVEQSTAHSTLEEDDTDTK